MKSARNLWAILIVAGFSGLLVVSCPTPTEDAPQTTSFEPAATATAEIGPSGGSLRTTGSDGTRYQVVFPAGWLGPSADSVQVAITPIEGTLDVPGYSRIVAGLRIEPDGLRLDKPAEITIDLASPVAVEDLGGFSCAEDGSRGEAFPLVLGRVTPSSQTLRLLHFSLAGVGAGFDCGKIAAGSDLSNTYRQLILCLILASGNDPDQLDLQAFRDLMRGWFYDWVFECLDTADSYQQLLDALPEVLEWYELPQWVVGAEFLGQSFAPELVLAAQKVAAKINTVLDQLDSECLQTGACGQAPLLSEAAKWLELPQRLAGVLEVEPLIRHDVVSFCGNLAGRLPASIEVFPDGRVLAVGDELELTALVKSAQRVEITAPILWTSDNPAIAEVGESDGKVTAKADGSATITADCGCNVQDSVVVHVDGLPPVPGNDGIITVPTVEERVVSLGWTKATDQFTPQQDLEYRIVWSTSSNIATAEQAVINGTVVQDWVKDIMGIVISELSPSTDYYFNVLVRDEAGNVAAYNIASVSTKSEEDRPPVPGGNGVLHLAEVADTWATVDFTKAADDRTAQSALEYQVVVSLSPDIATLDDALQNGLFRSAWVVDVREFTLSGCSPATQYYVNVVVRDQAHNAAAYQMATLTMKDPPHVEVSPRLEEIAVGQQLPITAKVKDYAGRLVPCDDIDWSISWSVPVSGIVTVSTSGLVTALEPGVAAVQASCPGATPAETWLTIPYSGEFTATKSMDHSYWQDCGCRDPDTWEWAWYLVEYVGDFHLEIVLPYYQQQTVLGRIEVDESISYEIDSPVCDSFANRVIWDSTTTLRTEDGTPGISAKEVLNGKPFRIEFEYYGEGPNQGVYRLLELSGQLIGNQVVGQIARYYPDPCVRYVDADFVAH
jgi:hypothetical protein